MQYSPLPSRDYLKPVLDLTPELALEALRFSAIGLICAVRTVLQTLLPLLAYALAAGVPRLLQRRRQQRCRA